MKILTIEQLFKKISQDFIAEIIKTEIKKISRKVKNDKK
jgi:hypothetical protein